MSRRPSELDADVREVLSRGSVEGMLFRLGPEQLERSLYVRVNEALESLGGKWNRKLKGHVFEKDPTPLLGGMLESGIVAAKNPDAFFPTPSDVVDEMLRLAVLDELPKGRPTRLLEPSAGTGAIAAAAYRAAPLSCAIDCVEIDADRIVKLSTALHRVTADLPPFGLPESLPRIHYGDFLTWGDGVGEYDRILMNPPFAIADDATAWLTHVERALDLCLFHTGRLVAVVPSGFQQRSDKKHTAFRKAITGRYEYFPLPDNAFRESGTGVNAGLLVVDGKAA